MSVGQMSVGEQSFGLLSVGEMSVGQMAFDEMTGHRHDEWTGCVHTSRNDDGNQRMNENENVEFEIISKYKNQVFWHKLL